MKKIFSGVLFLILMAGCIVADASENNKTLIMEKDNPIVKTTMAVDEIKTFNFAEKYKMDAAFILVKKREFKLYAVDSNGNILATYGCALGKNAGQKEKEGDMRTPDGIFPIDEILDASSWTHDFKDGKGEILGAYGPWFISLNTINLSNGHWGGIGIHGTHAPESVGTQASEGCIRLNNDDIVALKSFAKVGMKVVIEE